MKVLSCYVSYMTFIVVVDVLQVTCLADGRERDLQVRISLASTFWASEVSLQQRALRNRDKLN